jgi:hypothetical protein
MCDPITATVISGVGSAVAAGVSYMGQQDTLNAQNKANDTWVNYQRQQAQQAAARDEEQRQKAATAHQDTVHDLTPENQKDAQSAEESRLNTDYLKGSGAAPDANIAMLSGQGGSTSNTATDIHSMVTGAAQEARKRIAALATMSSYGGSFNGLQQNANQALAQGNEDIGLTANLRKGNTATLGTAQAVPVQKFAQGSDVAGSIASGLANIAGTAGGSWMKKSGTGIG